MRSLVLACGAAAVVAMVPARADASPWVQLVGLRAGPASDPQPTSSKAPASADAAKGQPATTAEPSGDDDVPLQPTSSKAPDASPTPDSPEPVDGAPPPVETASDSSSGDVSLDDERGGGKSARGKPFNRHGVGARAGISVIPTWVLARWVDTQTNALCRGDAIGNYAESQGLLKTEGCNFYVGGEYVYRQSRVLDIVGSMGYQRFHAPDGYWLDEFNATVAGAGGNPLTAADYTEINLSMMYIEADFVARAPIVVRDDFEFGLGGGAGVGLGIIFGGIYQTPIGSDPQGFTPGGGESIGSCQEISDLADFTRCTPRWDPDEDPDGNPPDDTDLVTPNSQLYATCTADDCSARDLRRFGYRTKAKDVPPVIPVVNLIISARFIIKDTFGISINGGWNTGFYFGGALTYFFGKQFQEPRGDGDTSSGRASSGPGQ